MTTVTFVLLTLFTWMVTSGTRLRLDQFTELSQYRHDEETKGFISKASHKKAATHDKTNLTQMCERFPEISVALEGIFTQNWIKKGCTLLPAVTLNCVLLNSHVNPLQRMKESVDGGEQNRHVCKCHFQQLLVYFLYKKSCLPEMETDNHCTCLNHISIFLNSVAHCSNIITSFVVDRWEIMDFICICKTCNLEVKTLQGFFNHELEPAVPDFLIFILSESHVSVVSSAGSWKTHVRVFYVQMSSNLCAPLGPKEAFVTQAGGVESVQLTNTSSWVPGCFLAALLLLGIYMTREKISPSRVSPVHGSNSSVVILFTMTCHCFSPSPSIHQPSAWSQVVVGISAVVCVSCALGRTVHVSVACRTAHSVMKLFCTMQQQFKTLPVTALFLWLSVNPPFTNNDIKHWFEGILDDTVGTTPTSWAVMGQIELLATLYCVFVSLLSLLQSILSKLNFLSILLNVQLLTCLQNPRLPTKYILVIKINRLI